jgi:hypothetical protein
MIARLAARFKVASLFFLLGIFRNCKTFFAGMQKNWKDGFDKVWCLSWLNLRLIFETIFDLD